MKEAILHPRLLKEVGGADLKDIQWELMDNNAHKVKSDYNYQNLCW